MPERTDYQVSEADHRELVEGENDASTKIQTQTEIVGEVTVRAFPARSWSGQPVAVTTDVQQIAGGLPQRKRLTIVNTGAEVVYLAPTRESCVVGTAYPLQAGPVGITMEHTASVFATCDVAKASTLAVYAEFRDGGPL